MQYKFSALSQANQQYVLGIAAGLKFMQEKMKETMGSKSEILPVSLK